MWEKIKNFFKWIANHTGISWVARKISSGWKWLFGGKVNVAQQNTPWQSKSLEGEEQKGTTLPKTLDNEVNHNQPTSPAMPGQNDIVDSKPSPTKQDARMPENLLEATTLEQPSYDTVVSEDKEVESIMADLVGKVSAQDLSQVSSSTTTDTNNGLPEVASSSETKDSNNNNQVLPNRRSLYNLGYNPISKENFVGVLQFVKVQPSLAEVTTDHPDLD